ncbi:carboxylesterase family protein [Xylanimonas sp. McL0601]|uniref:carboxylesterase family protein n=1 Tax=Xylanimonas sp. McL0601 TaxID=3414739 RepID=UPI003CF1F70B
MRKFGGDPDRVAIAGQSSGGMNELEHLVSAGSRGLFEHRAERLGPASRLCARWSAAAATP